MKRLVRKFVMHDAGPLASPAWSTVRGRAEEAAFGRKYRLVLLAAALSAASAQLHFDLLRRVSARVNVNYRRVASPEK